MALSGLASVVRNLLFSLARETGKIRHRAAAVTDERLKIMNEIISGIRMVKMYAWEWNFRDLVAQIRRLEDCCVFQKIS